MTVRGTNLPEIGSLQAVVTEHAPSRVQTDPVVSEVFVSVMCTASFAIGGALSAEKNKKTSEIQMFNV